MTSYFLFHPFICSEKNFSQKLYETVLVKTKTIHVHFFPEKMEETRDCLEEEVIVENYFSEKILFQKKIYLKEVKSNGKKELILEIEDEKINGKFNIYQNEKAKKILRDKGIENIFPSNKEKIKIKFVRKWYSFYLYVDEALDNSFKIATFILNFQSLGDGWNFLFKYNQSLSKLFHIISSSTQWNSLEPHIQEYSTPKIEPILEDNWIDDWDKWEKKDRLPKYHIVSAFMQPLIKWRKVDWDTLEENFEPNGKGISYISLCKKSNNRLVVVLYAPLSITPNQIQEILPAKVCMYNDDNELINEGDMNTPLYILFEKASYDRESDFTYSFYINIELRQNKKFVN